MSAPLFLSLGFIATTAYGLWCFGRACRWHRRTFVVLGIWLMVTAVAALVGWLVAPTSMPPRPFFLVFPPVVLMVVLFATRSGRAYIDALAPGPLVLVHTLRIPVELVLFGLFTYGAVPQLMTFEGDNPDIATGITAVLVYWLGYLRRMLPRWAIIAWHFLGLALLFNIVIRAVLSVPSPIQQLAFDQPNIGVLYFPFVWLPAVLVPMVLFAHLASLRQLLSGQRR